MPDEKLERRLAQLWARLGTEEQDRRIEEAKGDGAAALPALDPGTDFTGFALFVREQKWLIAARNGAWGAWESPLDDVLVEALPCAVVWW
jgi:hypothetical protein